MVNEKKIKKILAEMLVIDDPRYANRYSEYKTKKMKLRRIERNHPNYFSGMVRKTKRFFDEIERALQEEFEF